MFSMSVIYSKIIFRNNGDPKAVHQKIPKDVLPKDFFFQSAGPVGGDII